MTRATRPWARATRVSKAHLRIQAYGTVDETNAVLGIVGLHTNTDAFAKLDAMLARIQNELFDLGADLCVPDTGEKLDYEPLRILPKQVDRLESEIDELNHDLSLCAPSFCPAVTWRQLISIWPAPSAAAPNA